MSLHGSVDDLAQTQRPPRVASVRRRLAALRGALGEIGAATCVVLCGACVEPIAIVSDAPTGSPAKLGQMTEAFAARYTSPERSTRSEAARHRLESGALIPTRVFDDSLVWSGSPSATTRTLTVHGEATERGYRIDYAPERTPLLKPGDTRHTITLRRLPDNEFRWDTAVDFAIGSITADDVGEMFAQLFSASHDHEGTTLRATARLVFPRSTATLAKVFSLDSLTTHPSAQGTTTVALVIGIHPEDLRSTAPHFADYLDKYIATSRYRFSLADRNGALYFEAIGGDRHLTIRYRVKAGSIVSSLGPPRPLPDSLRLTSDLSIHVKMFQIGWRNLVTDFVIGRGEHSRTWTLVSQTEPDWQLPLITERVLRSPLRRPFQGAGASFEIGVVDTVGGQSLLVRRAHLEVKESQILRFLGGLASRVLNDLNTDVEREEAAYFRELVLAFEQDARAIR